MTANYIIIFSKKFEKMLDRLTGLEQELVREKLELFEEDPFYPSLRSKKIQGRPGYYEFSVNMDIRVIWYYQNGRVIVLFSIGHHDIVDEFCNS